MILLLPAVAFFALFVAWPLVVVFSLSLQQTNFITSSFVGLKNYIDSLKDESFRQAIANSVLYMAYMVPGHVLTSLLASLAVFRLPKRWHDSSRILFYLPVLSGGIIIAQVWRWVFHMDGPVNWFLTSLGGQAVNWFGQGSTAIPVICFIVVVSSFGANVIIMLSAMQSIDVAIFDAAKIDGATWKQTKWRIIVPIILPTIGLVTLLSAIASLQVVETIMMLAPQDFAATITYSIYRSGFLFSRYGMASAQAVILLLITVGISLIKRRLEHE